MADSDRWRLWKRLSVAVLGVYWVALLIATHTPGLTPPLGLAAADKPVHAGAYAGLAFLLAVAWSLHGAFGWRQGLVALAILASYGAVDELTQPWFDRVCELRDWQADVAGAAAGLAAFFLARRLVGAVLVKRWASAGDSRPDRST